MSCATVRQYVGIMLARRDGMKSEDLPLEDVEAFRATGALFQPLCLPCLGPVCTRRA